MESKRGLNLWQFKVMLQKLVRTLIDVQIGDRLFMGTGGGDLHIYAFHQENGLLITQTSFSWLRIIVQETHQMSLYWKLRRILVADP